MPTDGAFYHQNHQKRSLAMKFEQRRSHHRTEHYVQRMKDRKQSKGVFFADILKQQHKGNAEGRSEQRKRTVGLQFLPDMLKSIPYGHLDNP